MSEARAPGLDLTNDLTVCTDIPTNVLYRSECTSVANRGVNWFDYQGSAVLRIREFRLHAIYHIRLYRCSCSAIIHSARRFAAEETSAKVNCASLSSPRVYAHIRARCMSNWRRFHRTRQASTSDILYEWLGVSIATKEVIGWRGAFQREDCGPEAVVVSAEVVGGAEKPPAIFVAKSAISSSPGSWST